MHSIAPTATIYRMALAPITSTERLKERRNIIHDDNSLADIFHPICARPVGPPIPRPTQCISEMSDAILYIPVQLIIFIGFSCISSSFRLVNSIPFDLP